MAQGPRERDNVSVGNSRALLRAITNVKLRKTGQTGFGRPRLRGNSYNISDNKSCSIFGAKDDVEWINSRELGCGRPRLMGIV